MNESTKKIIFVIRDHPVWQGLQWSVAWPGRGTVKKPEHIRTIWNEAFKTGAFSVGFAVGSGRCFRVDRTLYEVHNDAALEHFLHGEIAELEGVSFARREEAEKFVDALEKIIMWKTLEKQEYHWNSS